MTGFFGINRNNPLSSLTIACLEDLSYTVDYSKADAFDAGDLTGSCCSSRRNRLRQLSPGDHTRRKLSEAGKATAIDYGKNLLEKRALPPGAPRIANGVEYVGDKVISVLYIEDDVIYEVGVGAD